MSLTQLHVLTSSSDATSTTSYEYFRNELLKQNENAPLWNHEPGKLGLHVDSVGHLQTLRHSSCAPAYWPTSVLSSMAGNSVPC